MTNHFRRKCSTISWSTSTCPSRRGRRSTSPSTPTPLGLWIHSLEIYLAYFLLIIGHCTGIWKKRFIFSFATAKDAEGTPSQVGKYFFVARVGGGGRGESPEACDWLIFVDFFYIQIGADIYNTGMFFFNVEIIFVAHAGFWVEGEGPMN